MKNPKFFLTTLFAAASALAPVAMTTTTAFVASSIPAQADFVIGADGLPDTTGFAEQSSAASSGQKSISENTIWNFTSGGNIGVSGNDGFNTNGYDLKLMTPSGNTVMVINGDFRGYGDVWFGNGRWEVNTSTRLNDLGDIWLSGGGFWVRSATTLSESQNVYLGMSNYNDWEEQFHYSALRLAAAMTINGTMTVLDEGTKLSSQNGGGLTVANLTGKGNITTDIWNQSSVLKVLDATDFTGTISLKSGWSLDWSSATATFGGVLGNGAVAGGSTLSIKTAAGADLDFSGVVGSASGTVDVNVSGQGTQTLSGMGYLGDVNVSGGKLALTYASSASGKMSVSGGELELGGFITISDTISATGGTLRFNDGVVVQLASDFKISGATYTDLDGSSSGSGNGYVSGTVTVYNVADGAAIEGTLSKVSYGDNEVELTGGMAVLDTDYSTYYINTGAVNYTALTNSEKAAELKSVFIGTGGILNLDADFDFASSPVSMTIDGKVNVADGATLNLGELSAATNDFTYITGTGTIAVASSANHDKYVTFGDEFTGTLQLSQKFNPGRLDIGGATELSLLSAWFWGGATLNTTADVLVDSYLKVSGSANVAFSGDVKNASDSGTELVMDTGSLDIGGNTLRLSSLSFGSSKGTSGTALRGNYILASGGTFTFNHANTTIEANLTFEDNTTINLADAGSDAGSSGSYSTSVNGGMTIAGGVTLNGTTTYQSEYWKTAEITGKITGTGGLNFAGSVNAWWGAYAYLILSNEENDFSGGITINRSTGVVQARNGGALGTGKIDIAANDGILAYIGTTGSEYDVIRNDITGGGMLRIDSGKVKATGDLSGLASLYLNTGTQFAVEVAADTTRSLDASLFGAGSFEKLGTGTLETSATAYNANTGATTVTEGTLKVKGLFGSSEITVGSQGTLELAGTTLANTIKVDGKLVVSGESGFSGILSGTGGVEVASDGVLTLGGNVTLEKAIKNSGTVEFAEGIVLNLANWESVIDTSGMMVFTIVDGGTIGDSWTNNIKSESIQGVVTFSDREGESKVDWTTTKGVIKVTTPAKTLTWNGSDNTWNWTDEEWKDSEGGTEKFYDGDSVIFDKDATLTVATIEATDATDGKAGVVAGNITIGENVDVTLSGGTVTSVFLTINEGAMLSVSQALSGGNLSGTGTLVLSGNTALIDGTNFTDDWTGTVKILNHTGVEDFNLNDYGNENSKVELSGLSGSYSQEAVLVDLVLTDATGGAPAYQITGGVADVTRVFSGGVSGEGTFDHAWADGNKVTYSFSGDVGKWEGTFKHSADGKENTLEFTGSATNVLADIQNDAGTLNLSFNTASDTVYSGSVVSNGSVNLNKNGTAKLTLSGTTPVHLYNLNVNSGVLELTKDVTVDHYITGSGSSAQVNILSGTIDIGRKFELKQGANATFGAEGTTGPTLTLEQIQIHNANSSAHETLTIKSGTVNVTSENKDQNTNSGILLGHWPSGRGILTLEGGTVNVLNSYTTISWDSQGTLNISGGEFNTYGVAMGGASGDTRGNASTLNLSGGRLNVGAGGITDNTSNKNDNKVINFSGGTLGTLSDSWTTYLKFVLSNTATVDTKIVNSDNGGTITLAAPLTGDGKLVKTGVGTLVLSGNNTYSGGTEVQAGRLAVGNANGLGTGTVTLADGTTIARTDDTLTISAGAIKAGKNVIWDLGSVNMITPAFDVAGSLTWEEGVAFDVDLDVGSNYVGLKLLSAKEGLSDAGLSNANLLISGSTVSSRAKVEFSVIGSDLLLNYTAGEVYTLVWDDSKTGAWAVGDARTWTIDGSTETATFENGDSVIFSSADANVGVNGTVLVNTVSATEDVKIAASSSDGAAKIVLTGDVEVAEGKTATIEETVEVSAPNGLAKTGDGTLSVSGMKEFNTVTLNGGTLNLSGTTTVSGGVLVNAGIAEFRGATTIGGSTTVASDAQLTIEAKSSSFMGAASIETDALLQVDTGEGANVTHSGKISGTGTFEKIGDGTLVLSGDNGAFTGKFLVSDGTLQLGSALSLGAGYSSSHSSKVQVEVAAGGTLDLNGMTKDGYYGNYVLSGGSLVNNNTEIGEGNRQLAGGISLTADSTVGGNANFGMISGGYAANTLDLGGYTLTKTGSNFFWLATTTVTAGTIDIQEGYIKLAGNQASNLSAANLKLGASGEIQLNGFSTAVASLESAGRVNIGGNTLTLNGDALVTGGEFTGGTGSVVGGADVSFVVNNATESPVSIEVALNLAGSLVKSGAGTLALTGAGNTISGGVAVNGGRLEIAGAGMLGGAPLTLGGGTLARHESVSDPIALTQAVTVSAESKVENMAFSTGAWTFTNDLQEFFTDDDFVAVTLTDTTFSGDAGSITVDVSGIDFYEGVKSIVLFENFTGEESLFAVENGTITLDGTKVIYTANDSILALVWNPDAADADCEWTGTTFNGQDYSVTSQRRYLFQAKADEADKTPESVTLLGAVDATSAMFAPYAFERLAFYGDYNFVGKRQNDSVSAFLTLMGGGDMVSGTILVADDEVVTFENTVGITGLQGTPGNLLKEGRGTLVLAADAEVFGLGTVDIREGTFGLSSVTTGTGAPEFKGTISGAGTLMKTGDGDLVLSAANTHTGGTVVDEGLLRITHRDALGTGLATVNTGAVLELNAHMDGATNARYALAGGTLRATIETGSGNAQIASGKSITLTENSTIDAQSTFGMISSGYGSNTIDLGGKVLTKTGEGSFLLCNTTITEGTLKIVGGTIASISLTNPEVSPNATDASAADFIFELEEGKTGGITVGGATTEFSVKSISTSADNKGTAQISISGTDTKFIVAGTETGTETYTYAGTIIGEGKLVKQGNETLVLSGKNTYSGGLDIQGGTVQVDSCGWGDKGNLGSDFTQSKLTLSSGGVLEVTAVQNDSTEQGYGNGGALRGFSVTSGTGTYRYSGEGESLIAHNSASDGANQHIGLASGATLVFDVVKEDATLNVSKLIASNAELVAATATLAETDGVLEETDGMLKKIGVGKLVLSGANLYTGGTVLSEGALQASGTALGTGGIAMNAGTELALNGATVSGEISGDGKITTTGETTLSKKNTFAGDYVIDGTLTLKNLATLGASGLNVELNGTLQNKATTTLGAVVTGKGTLSQVENSMNLAGSDFSEFTGNFVLAGGTLSNLTLNSTNGSTKATISGGTAQNWTLDNADAEIQVTATSQVRLSGTITLETGRVVFGNSLDTAYFGGSGAVNLGDDIIFDFEDLDLVQDASDPSIYRASVLVFDTTDINLTGWKDLSWENIQIHGGALDAHYDLEIGDAGNLTIVMEAQTLVWKTSESVWDLTSLNWKLEEEAALTDIDIKFADYDTVKFTASDEVTIASGMKLRPTEIVVEGDVDLTLKAAGNAEVIFGETQLESGSSLTLVQDEGKVITFKNTVVGTATETFTLQNAVEVSFSETLDGDSVVSGDLKFVKDGTGTLLADVGQAEFTGTTSIDAGKVVVSATNALGTGVVTLNGGTLELSAAADTTTTVNNVIAGTTAKDAPLVISGAGIVELGVANTYSGSTTVTGTAVAKDAAAFGTSAVSVEATGTVELNSDKGIFENTFSGAGTLAVASATTATITTSLDDLTGTLEATGGATLIVNTDADSTFSGTLKLSEGDTAGTFEKADETTLTLSGAFESVAGSTLKVSAGTLKVGNDDTAQSYAGALNVSDDAIFEKVGENTLTLSGALDASGSASILKLEAGTLKIGNADTAQRYAGELSLAADTNFEKVGANTLTLAKLTGKGATTVSAGTLELATATDATLESVIDGAGTLKKSGAGALTLAAGTSVTHVDLAAGTLANVELTEGGVSKLTVSATGTTLKKATMDAGTLNVAAAAQTTLEDEVALSGGTIVLGDVTPVEDEATVVGKFKVTGSATVGAGVTFNIDSLTYSTVTNPNTTLEEATVTLNVFDVDAGATLIGWDADTLGKGNFTIGESNAALSDRTQLKFEDGNLEISNTIYSLTWEGGDNVWASGNGDAWTHAANPEDTVYMNSDRVTFAADATVTLGSHVAPTTMTVNAGLDLEIEKSETYKITGAGTVSLGEDARLVLNSAHDYTGATTLADGATLQLNLAAGDSAQFKSAVLVADGAQGTLMIDTGALSAEAALETVLTGDLSTSGLVLEKLGAGTLSVTDKLSGFTSEGRVEVTAGTLKAYGASALGAASLAVAEGASLNVVADSDAVFGNSLVGQGLFEKSGGAVLTIEQANAFAGDATVSAGTLKLADIDALGDARVDTLFTVAEGATLDIDFGGNFGKTLAGAGTINANSGDILVLGGSGEAFTGTFKVNGGTVRAQTATALGNGTIELADANKKLVFEIIEDESFDGSFVGAGTITVETASLTKTLTWTGDGSSNFSGTVEVKDDSSLAAKNAGMLGNASASTVLGANSELVLGGDVDSTLEAKVSGNGDLVKVGKGTVKLANTANAYSGKTYINEGTLRVDSALALGATSQIQLAEKTVLDIGLQSGENLTFNKDVRGYGDVAISGKGTLSWTQRKLFHGKLGVAGSTLNTTQFFESNSDVVLSENARWNAKQGFSVGANAAITLHAGAAPIYTTMATTTVPSGTQLASGGFLASANKEGTVVLSDISVIPGSNGAETLVTFDVNNQSEVKKSRIVLTKDASVSLDNVSVQVLLGDSFVDASNLPEISFINLDGSDARVIGEFTKKTVVFADGTEVEYLYDVRDGNLTLEPVSNNMNLAYAAMVSMPLETFNQDVQSLHRRMDQRRFDTGTNKDQWEFFAQAQSMQVDNGDDRSDSATFDFSTYGSLVGGDVRLGESTVFGLALAYDRGTADIHDNQGEITMDNYRVTAYMGTVIGDSYFAEGGLHYGFASYELDREGEYGVNTGDTNGWSAGAFFTTGGVLPTAVENLFLTPYVGLAYLHTAVEKFDEVGTQSTSVADMEANSLRARIGVGASYGFSLGEVPSRLGLDLAFSHEFLDDELDADVTAAGMSYTRTLTEKTTSASTVTLGASLDFSLSENTGLYLGYSADLGLNSDIAHRANIGFRFTY